MYSEIKLCDLCTSVKGVSGDVICVVTCRKACHSLGSLAVRELEYLRIVVCILVCFGNDSIAGCVKYINSNTLDGKEGRTDKKAFAVLIRKILGAEQKALGLKCRYNFLDLSLLGSSSLSYESVGSKMDEF